MKKWIIAALILIFVGSGIIIGVSIALDMDFSKLTKTDYETSSFDIYENFDNISVETTSDLKLLPSDDETCTVTCRQKTGIRFSIEVIDKTLVIKEGDSREWYDRIDYSFSSPDTAITIKLPAKEYGSLLVTDGYGDVKIPADFTFSEISVTGNCGETECNASASGSVRIVSYSGNISMKNVSAESIQTTNGNGETEIAGTTVTGRCSIVSDSGDVKLSKLTCKDFDSATYSGETILKDLISEGEMNIKTEWGDIGFKECDAGEINIETKSGEVSGTLLSEKIFLTETECGSVHVPKTASGGKCSISTASGDIDISLA